MARGKRIIAETPEQIAALGEIERKLAAGRPAAAPDPEVDRVEKQFRIANYIYDRGLELPAEIAATVPNLTALRDSHALRKSPAQ